MCHRLRQDFLMHHRHMMTTVHKEFIWSLTPNILLFPAIKLCFFIRPCLQMYACCNLGQPTLTTRTGPQGQVCVCARHTHVCLHVHAYSRMFSKISTLQCSWLYPTCHHTRQEIMLCARGGVSPKEEPRTDCCSGTPAFIMPDPIKHRWITDCMQWKNNWNGTSLT